MNSCKDPPQDSARGSTLPSMDLSFLTDEERKAIQDVLRRDQQVRHLHDQHLSTLKTQVEQLRRTSEAVVDLEAGFATCACCTAQLGSFFSSGISCQFCHIISCSKCTVLVYMPKKTVVCILCAKQWELHFASGEWMDLGKNIPGSETKTKSDRKPQDNHPSVVVTVDGDNRQKKLFDNGHLPPTFRRSLHVPALTPIESQSERTGLRFLTALRSPFSHNTLLSNAVNHNLLHVRSDAVLHLHSNRRPDSGLRNHHHSEQQLPGDFDPPIQLEMEAEHRRMSARKAAALTVASTNTTYVSSPKTPKTRSEIASLASSTATGLKAVDIRDVFPPAPVPVAHVDDVVKDIFQPALQDTDPQLRVAFNYEDGKLEVYVLRCRNLPSLSRNRIVAPSPYVKAYLYSKNVRMKRKTKTLFNTFNPEYEEVLKYDTAEEAKVWHLVIAVCSKKGIFKWTTVLGETVIDVTEKHLCMEKPMWIHFPAKLY